MIKTTITGKAYIVNVLAAPLSLYAVLPDGSRELLRTITETGQHFFIAQSGATLFEGGAYGLITGPFDAARVAIGGGAGSTTATPGPKGEKGDPGEKGDKGDPGESPAAEDVALQLVPLLAEEVELTGPEAPTNTNTNYFSLGSAYLAPGVVLREFGYHVKTNAANGMCEQPVYLGIWELAEDGATWAKLGASVNTQVQVTNSDPLWAFELGAVKLSGRPLRFCLLSARDDAWRTDLLMGVRCVATEEADTYVYPNGNATAFVVKYTLRGYKTLTEKGEKGDPADHTQLDALQTAVKNAQQTAADALNNANLANTNLANEKNEALQHLYWHHAGKHEALAALMGPNGAAYFPEAGHVTAAEKAKWDAAAADAAAAKTAAESAAQADTLEKHTTDTTVHLTAAERKAWDDAVAAVNYTGLYDSSEGVVVIGRAARTVNLGWDASAQAGGVAIGCEAMALDGETVLSASVETAEIAEAVFGVLSPGSSKAKAQLGGKPGIFFGKVGAEFCISFDDLKTRLTSSGVGGGFDDTGRITGGTAKTAGSTATGKNAQATGGSSTATGYGAEATDTYATATGHGAEAKDLSATATGATARATNSFATATGQGAKATGISSTATGNEASATGVCATATGAAAQAGGSNSTATGYKANSSGRGSFAYGAFAKADKDGEGVLRVSADLQPSGSDENATALKLVGANSPVSTEQLDGACGLGYKETTADYRYAKLKDIFDLADRAADLLALLER